ncbi:hypothetical protein [Tumebacillus flagellatus]|nr:hypothetical protein [Tumebacillus flagellatus]
MTEMKLSFFQKIQLISYAGFVKTVPVVLRYGFTERRPGLYVKTVPTYEVEDAYDILYQAVYRGLLFHANETGDRNINLMHSGFEGLAEARELGFEMVEPGLCSKVVSPDEVERLILIKDPILGFE